jgi:hypothetical protein
VSSRHVLFDEPKRHFPDRIEIELHIDRSNLARSTGFAIALYRDRKSVWRTGRDRTGGVDVAVIAREHAGLPPTAPYRAFTPQHRADPPAQIDLWLLLDFPLGFHATLHHMRVARHAVVAASFGLRFQAR